VCGVCVRVCVCVCVRCVYVLALSPPSSLMGANASVSAIGTIPLYSWHMGRVKYKIEDWSERELERERMRVSDYGKPIWGIIRSLTHLCFVSISILNLFIYPRGGSAYIIMSNVMKMKAGFVGFAKSIMTLVLSFFRAVVLSISLSPSLLVSLSLPLT